MPFAFSLSVKDAFNTSEKYDLQFLHLLKYIYILGVFPSLFLKQTDFFSSAIDEDRDEIKMNQFYLVHRLVETYSNLPKYKITGCT